MRRRARASFPAETEVLSSPIKVAPVDPFSLILPCFSPTAVAAKANRIKYIPAENRPIRRRLPPRFLSHCSSASIPQPSLSTSLNLSVNLLSKGKFTLQSSERGRRVKTVKLSSLRYT